MKTLPLNADNWPLAEQIHAASGYDFRFPDSGSPLIEAACLIVDAQGFPIVASVAKRTPEVMLAMRNEGHPALKLQALANVHSYMREALTARGYSEANCFLPPEINRNYGRHLQRIFGWQKSWPGYTMRSE